MISTYPATSSNSESFRISNQPNNSTIGSTDLLPYFYGSRITTKARALLPIVQNEKICRSLKRLIDIIDMIVSAFELTGGDINYLAPIRASLPEDGSVLLEWVSPDFRLSFNIETNQNDSSWIVVTSKRLDEIVAYGSLSDFNSRDIVMIVLSFLFSNS